MKRYWVLAAGLLVVLTGCAMPSSSDSSTGGGVPAPAVEQPDSARSSTAQEGSSTSGQQAATQRQVVRTANVWVVVENLGQQSQAVQDLTASAGGYVARVSTGQPRPCDPDCPVTSDTSSKGTIPDSPTTPNTMSGTESGMVSFVLRIPAAKYDSAMDQLQGLGEVTSLTVNADDVTAATQDLAARIEAQRASVHRVRVLMDQANTLDEVVRIEQELAERQSDLESMLAQQKRLADQVAMATISVTLLDATTADQLEPAQPHWWDEAWNAFTTTWHGILLAFAVLLPFALVVICALIAWLLIRRRRQAHPSSSPNTTTDGAQPADQASPDVPTS